MEYVFIQEDLILPREEIRALINEVSGGKLQPVWHDSADLESIQDQVDIVITLKHEVGEKTLQRWRNLKMVSMGFTGYDKVDQEYCKSSLRRFPISLYYVPDYSSDSVAELTVGLTLAVLRNVRGADHDIRAGYWDSNPKVVPGVELRGKSIGILGAGKIGTASARLFQAFGCSVIGWSRSHEGFDQLGLKCEEDLDGLNAIFRESDVLVLHLPATDGTKHIVNAERLAWMKPTSILINAARSELVDTDALLSALQHERIRGAGLDVFDDEGSIMPWRRTATSSALMGRDNVIVTPHIGFKTEEALRRLAIIVIENIARFRSNSKENRLLP